MDKKNNAAKFIQRMKKDEAFRREIGTSLLDAKEGDWSQVVTIGQQFGFNFSEQELVDAIPEGFYKGKGKNPGMGWDQKTRENTKAVSG